MSQWFTLSRWQFVALLFAALLAGCSDGDGFSGRSSRVATLVVEDEINWLSDGVDDVGYLIHEISFSVLASGPVTIDVLSAGLMSPSLDTQIYLLADDGAVEVNDVLYVNDDGLPGDDGSIIELDSYLRVDLEAGDYRVYVSGCCFTAEEAIAGYRVVAGGALLPDLVVSNVNGAYQVTISGDVILN